MTDQLEAAYGAAEKILVDAPIGSAVKISAPTGYRNFYFQTKDSGIWEISPREYCRASDISA